MGNMPKKAGQTDRQTDRQTDGQTDRHHLTVVKQDFVAAKNASNLDSAHSIDIPMVKIE